MLMVNSEIFSTKIGKAQAQCMKSFDLYLGIRRTKPFLEGKWVLLYYAMRHERPQKKFYIVTLDHSSFPRDREATQNYRESSLRR